MMFDTSIYVYHDFPNVFKRKDTVTKMQARKENAIMKSRFLFGDMFNEYVKRKIKDNKLVFFPSSVTIMACTSKMHAI